MVGGAVAAETAATVAYRTVEEEEGNGVIVARNSHRSHFGEGAGGRIEEFGGQLGRVVRERNSVELTAGDEHGAVGQDNRIGEGASIRHGIDGFHGGNGGRGAYGDDVGIGGGVGVLVVW